MIGSEGMKDVAQALSKGALKHLTHLNLNGNTIGSQGMKDFVQALSKGALKHLTHLNLGGNTIGSEGMKDLAQLLSKRKRALNNLTYLNLGVEAIYRTPIGECRPVPVISVRCGGVAGCRGQRGCGATPGKRGETALEQAERLATSFGGEAQSMGVAVPSDVEDREGPRAEARGCICRYGLEARRRKVLYAGSELRE
eukprot:scaffold216244_cov27-Tisochrysis_lutea.AAC.2